MGRFNVSLPACLSSLVLLCGLSACGERDHNGGTQDTQGDYSTCVPLCDSKECGGRRLWRNVWKVAPVRRRFAPTRDCVW